ncbi:molybdenum cofactor guanylyltransferase [Psychrobacillus sp.]|uniref:molybdenum cofactor guanylyltransferase n=1 Tax=Psychrobacillus sp. TaxID=1871623 RepID=UPI0028BD3E25|nr:molybdenum cofactor guanylyltransferase [Psychrobacillus sp.]
MRTVGIVLAGGMSRRFGSPKAFAKYKDDYFYELSYRALENICEKVIIVTRAELMCRFPENECTIVDDEMYKGDGPLAGIYSAMRAVEAERYIVLPCDMPFIDQEVIYSLSKVEQTAMILAVCHNEQFHPLVSIWSGEAKDLLKNALDQNKLSVMSFLQGTTTEWIPANTLTTDPKTAFQNVNIPF